MQPLSPEIIQSERCDDSLFQLIGAELDRRLPEGRSPTDEYVRRIRALPIGLRSMAATYELDVSLTLDDLGWHFANWHHEGLAEETALGLVELGADRLAELFKQAFLHARHYWSAIGHEGFSEWYDGSALEKLMDNLNREAWKLQKEMSVLARWVPYARRFPERMS